MAKNVKKAAAKSAKKAAKKAVAKKVTKKAAAKPAKKAAKKAVAKKVTKKAAAKPAKKAAKKAVAKKVTMKAAAKPANKAVKKAVAKKVIKKAAAKPANKAVKKAVTSEAKSNPVAKPAPKPLPDVGADKASGGVVTERSQGVAPIVLHHRPPTDVEKAELREKLIEMRRELSEDLQRLEQGAFSVEGRDISSNHIADSSSDQYEQDFAVSIIEKENSELWAIQRALDKLDGRLDMPYGRCEASGEWISIERLKAKPHARLSVRMVAKFENEGGGEEYGVSSDQNRY